MKIAATTIVLVSIALAIQPGYSSDTAAMTGDADAGKQVFKWICAPTVPTEAKYLPGSCRG